MTDFWGESGAKKWLRAVLDGMAPKVQGSAATISLVPGHDGKFSEGDAKFWVELGASIMMDKPIIAVAEPGQVIPERLKRVADVVLYVDLSAPDAGDRVQAAIDRVLGDELG